jgi:uncharacterized protein YukE
MTAPSTQSKGTDPQKLFNDVQGTVAAVERGDWVNAGLGIANTAMDIVGVASNPLSGFLAAGFSWAIEHVDFLREPFDALLGNPQAIQAMSQTFKAAGGQVQSISNEYKRVAVAQTSQWTGTSADGYRAAANKHANGMDSLAKACNGVASAVSGAGQLVGTVRKMIMDLISQAVADMVMKIIQWLAASILTFGAAIAGAIADIVSTAVKYAKKLTDFLQKLAGSLQKLMDLVKKVSEIAKIAEQVIQAISMLANKGASPSGGAGTRPSAGGLGITEGQLNQASQGAGGQYAHNPGGGGTHAASAGGPQVSAPPTIPGGPSGGSHGGGAGPSGPQVHEVPTFPSAGGTPRPGTHQPGPGGGQVSQPPTFPGGPGQGQYPGGPGGPGSPGTHGQPGVPGGPGGVGTPTGPGRWEDGHWDKATGKWVEGHWEKGTPTGGASGGQVGGTPTTRPGDWYRPDMTVRPTSMPGLGGPGLGGGGELPDLTTHAAGGGSGSIPTGGMPGLGGGGGGGGGMPPMPGGPGGGGTGASMTPGGAAGVMAAGTGGAMPSGGGVPSGGGSGGGAGGGMMGGAPMAGAAGQQGGGGSDHKRKVKLEGEPLVEPPKAAKPIIGE